MPINIPINADTSGAINSINSFEKSALKAFGIVAAGAAAIFSANKIINFFEDATQEAINQENAINSLNVALGLAGDYTEEASKSMLAFADEMQKTTIYGDDLVISQLALAKNMGATNAQATELVKAAANLSAITGNDLETSTRQLALTLGGTAGALGKNITLVRGLTEEQLKAGEAIRLINTRFADASAIRTFGQALQASKNTVSDLYEEVGALITQNPFVIEAVKLFSVGIQKLTNFIAANRDNIISWVNFFVGKFLRAIPVAINLFGGFAVSVSALVKILNLGTRTIVQLIKALLDFKVVKDLFDFFFKSFVRGLAVIVGGFRDFAKAIGFPTEALDALEEKLGVISFSDNNFGQDIIDGLDLIVDGSVAADESLDKMLQGLANGSADANEFIVKLVAQLEAAKIAANEIKNSGGGATTPPEKVTDRLKGIWESFNEDFQKNVRDFGKTAALMAKGFEAGALILQGKAGAQKAVSGVVALAADAYMPGIGAAVGPFVDALQQGPEFVKKMVSEFVDALPALIEGLVEAIPVLIEVLIQKAPDLIAAIVNNIPTLIDALVDALPAFISALIEAIPKIVAGFIKAIPTIITALVKALPNLIIEIVKALGKGIVDAITGAVKSAGGLFGGGGVLSKVSDTINPFDKDFKNSKVNPKNWFAEGITEIPGGYPNDSYHAMLTSGERVVDNATNQDLKAFLAQARGMGTQKVEIVVQVGQEQLARCIYNLNRAGFRTA